MPRFFPFPDLVVAGLIASLSLPAVAEDPVAPDSASYPVAVGNQWVNPDSGERVGTVEGADAFGWAAPVPGRPGVFRFGDLLADAQTGAKVGTAGEDVRIEEGAVVRYDADGKRLWSVTPAPPAGSVRPPDRVVVGDRVVVAGGTRLFGFDLGTGAPIWESDGPGDRLHAHGEWVLATSCAAGALPQGRFLVARRARDGQEAWRLRLPDETDPDPIVDVGSLLLVRGERPGGGWAKLVDGSGKAVHEFAEAVACVVPAGSGLLVVGATGCARLEPASKSLWRVGAPAAGRGDHAGAVPAGDGEMLVYTWNPIADSGVSVARIRLKDGSVVWKAHCDGLGVPHSKYWHRAYVELRGDRVLVVSQGAGGHFIDARDLRTGFRKTRHDLGGH